MSEDALIRLANLRALNLDAKQLRERLGSSYPYWYDLLKGDRSFGEKAARRIEEGLGLPRGCLDTPEGCKAHAGKMTQPAPVKTCGRSVYAELLADYFDKMVPNDTTLQVPAFTLATEALADYVRRGSVQNSPQSPALVPEKRS